MRRSHTANPSPETLAALDRATALAHDLAARLAGDRPPAERAFPDSARAAELAAGMMAFLARLDAGDVKLLFDADGSLRDIPCRPLPDNQRRSSPFDAMIA